jgi:hypothetical protein
MSVSALSLSTPLIITCSFLPRSYACGSSCHFNKTTIDGRASDGFVCKNIVTPRMEGGDA